MQTFNKSSTLLIKHNVNLTHHTLLFCTTSSSTFDGTRANLTRADSDKKLNKTELIQHAIYRDKLHHANLYASSLNITSPVRAISGYGAYIMTLSIGTPAITYSAIVDTGSDLIWTQCQPCKSCFNQSTAIYDPSMSSTVNAVPCGLIIDSGTTITVLQIEGYIQVIETIVLLVKDNLPMAAGDFDLCYQLQAGMPPPSLPNMIFHFDGADMEIPDDNYMIIYKNLWCLAMSGSGDFGL
ncbi:hypothetical protein LUZ60_010752 [Juncus effusus]|nr:hypothetical protein LUZ60_010752 [Juncus effusus]